MAGWRTSPSQVATFTTCPRKWWFKWLMKLGDGKDPASRDLGTVLHEVCERWLEANETGRNIDGMPVDMYPPDWHHVREFGRDTGRRISMMDQALVRVLVQKGIDNGTLRRLAGRQLERNMVVKLVDGVHMQCYIDQDAPGIVEDHKTTKHKGYALSEKKLREDVKMLCYAVAKLDEEPGKPVLLRLNYYSKAQDKDPWAVEACIQPHDVVNFKLAVLLPAVQDMGKLREQSLTVDDWAKVEGPRKKGACDEYGGCPFAEICSRIKTPARHQQFLTKPTPEQRKKSKPTMAHFRKRAPLAPAPAATATVETPAPTPPPVQKVETTIAPPEVVNNTPKLEAPPWAVAGCRACKGTGINSKAEACRACDTVSGRNKGPTSSQFELWTDDAGILRWKPASGSPITPETKKDAPKAGETPKADTPAQTPPPKADHKEDAKKAAEVATVASITQAAQKVVEAAAVHIQGWFDLYIGCAPTRQPRIHLSEILAKEGNELAAASGKASYYELDAFQRRDAIAAQASNIARGLVSPAQGLTLAVVSAAEMTPDERSLLVALRPLARNVIERT